MKTPYSQFPWHKLYKSDSLIDEFYENGYIVIRLDGVDYDEIISYTNRYLADDRYNRVYDGWKTSKFVKSLATHNYVVRIINRLYDKECFPFQTLNFMYGTEQPVHSDMIHFNSLPQHYMCGAWVALENCEHDNGPLIVYPGSHRLPYFSLELIGLSPTEHGNKAEFDELRAKYETKISEFCKCLPDPKTILLKKGECIIWAANLLHGGSAILDKKKTRYSQVTHYYFSGCKYYTPWFSNKSSIYYTTPSVIS